MAEVGNKEINTRISTIKLRRFTERCLERRELLNKGPQTNVTAQLLDALNVKAQYATGLTGGGDGVHVAILCDDLVGEQ